MNFVFISPNFPRNYYNYCKGLKENGVNVPVNRAAVVYRSKKYISLYTAEDGEYDFCDGGKRCFTDLFDGAQITFPAILPKGKFFLFERPNK